MTLSIALLIFILFIIIWIFIYRVVGQMHEHILQIVLSWYFIRVCSKSGQSLIINVYAEGIDAVHKDVYSQIKFKTINQ